VSDEDGKASQPQGAHQHRRRARALDHDDRKGVLDDRIRPRYRAIHPARATKIGDRARRLCELAKAVDPHIEATGGLSGLIIETPGFPGWKSFGAMINQFRFVRDHHKRIKRIGVVTDSHMGDVAEHLTSHFVSAEIKHFPAGQTEQARQWIISGS
jgi:hypothetical protein